MLRMFASLFNHEIYNASEKQTENMPIWKRKRWEPTENKQIFLETGKN